jgi:hypothetical protein
MRTWYEESMEGKYQKLVLRFGFVFICAGSVRIEVAGIVKAALKTGIIEEGMLILRGHCNAPLYGPGYSSA